MKLALYGTSACHLCEEAAALTQRLGLAPELVDIADDDALRERYGLRIPVLRRADSGAELEWPFDAVQLARFLA